MIISILLIKVFLLLILLFNEIFLLKFKNFATSVFLCFYFGLFVLVPLILHVFFGGARSIVAGKQYYFFDETVYHIMNIYGLVIVLTFFCYVFFIRKNVSILSSENLLIIQPAKKKYKKNRFQLIFSISLIFGGVLFFFSTGMSLTELMVGSRFGWFSNPSAFIVGIAISHYFFSLTPTFIFCFLQGDKKYISVLLLIFGISALLFYGIISQDRKWLFYIFSGVVAHIYVANNNKLPITKKFAVITVTILFVLFISQFVRDFLTRVLLGQAEMNDFIIELSSWFSFLIEFGDISYFYRASCETIYYTLENGVIEWLAVLRRNLLFFVPTGFSFGLKPEDLSAIFSDIVKGEDSVRRGNMPPGFFGLLVMSFGIVIPILLLSFIPWVLNKLDRGFYYKTNDFYIVFLCCYISSFLLLMRGDDSSAIYFLIFNFFIFKIAFYLSRFVLFKVPKWPK